MGGEPVGEVGRDADAVPVARRGRNINAWTVFWLIIYIVLVIKLVTIQEYDNSFFFAAYSILVSAYILTRFAVGSLHVHDESFFPGTYQPTVTFGVPSMNEGEHIRETIMRIAQVDYPKHLFNIKVVDDGSSDNTYEEMLEAKRLAAQLGVDVQVTQWKVNRGKREGMAECVRQSTHEIIVFIDSDSFVAEDITTHLTKYFIDERVAAVTGHAYVANPDENVITKMQTVRYFVAFKAYKGAESLFGAVSCCSGCCSAYRREHLNEIMDEWLNQKFLGVQCTYGDDRSLTNFLLRRGFKTVYSPDAIAKTIVPSTMRAFMKQQLRWKKSWVRESLIASTFIWRRNPFVSISFLIGVALPLLAPIVVFRALIWFPLQHDTVPYFYVFGLVLMALLYGLYYKIYTQDRNWVYGSVFAVFYTLVLIWQLPWAILTLRDARWGTR